MFLGPCQAWPVPGWGGSSSWGVPCAGRSRPLPLDAADRVVVGGHWHGSGPRPGKEPEVPGVVTGLGLRKGHGSDAQL